MQTIVTKFGGSSLADAAQFRKVAAIIREKPERRFVVASAPGKRCSADTKVTDMLYSCYDAAAAHKDFLPLLAKIETRFADIIKELDISFDIAAEIALIRSHLETMPERDYMASRGEYLNSRILAAFLGFQFIDAGKYVRFFEDGAFDSEGTNKTLKQALADVPCAVLPGFYGAMPDGTVHTFSRGGSDITGSIVARAVGAELYENWTDVSGMLSADPRIVENPHTIPYITYRELRELSYMGASVLHEDAIFPVRKENIPINIRNTNDPAAPGTMIVPTLPAGAGSRKVTGIAGRTGFSAVLVEKSMMNSEIGFGAKLLQIFAKHGISFEHTPSGIDTISVIVGTKQFREKEAQILEDIQNELHPDAVSVEHGLAMIAVVGHGMVFSKGIAARVFQAIAEAEINIRMIDQGSSELNIIIGVEEADYSAAICSIYRGLKDLI